MKVSQRGKELILQPLPLPHTLTPTTHPHPHPHQDQALDEERCSGRRLMVANLQAFVEKSSILREATTWLFLFLGYPVRGLF